jgi:hypothetical protein
MSGYAAYALVLSEDRVQFARLKLYPSGEHLPPSRGESPFPLDCYLSWMSPDLVEIGWFASAMGLQLEHLKETTVLSAGLALAVTKVRRQILKTFSTQ